MGTSAPANELGVSSWIHERTAHIVIADGMNVTQDAALKLIKKYKSDLEDFGRLRFEFVPFLTRGGPGDFATTVISTETCLKEPQ